MASVRIYQLAKKLGRPSKELVEEIRKQGLEVKSYMSSVDEETAQLIVSIFAPMEEVKSAVVATARPAALPKKKPIPETERKRSAKSPQKQEKEAIEAANPQAAAVKKSSEKAPVKEKIEKPGWPTLQKEAREGPKLQAPVAVTAVKEPPSSEAAPRTLLVPEAITVKELAEKMGVKASDIIKTLMQLEFIANINQILDFDLSKSLCEKYGFQAKMAGAVAREEVLEKAVDLAPRPPVVTVMGHVDHGKTRLLDAVRQTNLAEKEAGGITQHIGAYVVEVGKGKIVFFDTPGHEAFTAMRARGAQVTDIVVLVVAADDGVMPQTKEAITHAKAAGVPIVVAINKIDKPNARPDMVKKQLSELGLVPEEWGGQTIFCEISAKERIGIDALLEMILLQAEMLELKANPHRPASGTIIEAKLDKGRGPVCTVLIQDGTLKVGDPFVCGLEYGKVRAMFSDRGKRIQEVTPSMPVEVLGVSDVPRAGDTFQAVEEERKARQIGNIRRLKQREKLLARKAHVTLDALYKRVEEGEAKELNVVLRADVHGSLQAVSEAMEKLSTDKVQVKIIHGSVGGIRETDIALASASDAVVIGFNVRPTAQASAMAEREGVDVRLYTVIYDLISSVKAAIEGLSEPVIKEVILGRAEVRETYNISRVGTVAGCYIAQGAIKNTSNIRLIRDSVVVYEGKVASLRRFKDDVPEVSSGYECGISVEGFNDIKLKDILESYEFQKNSEKL